jgi:hypothetical protein
MAKAKQTGGISMVKKSRKKRHGVHSKSKTSKLKSSRNYKKSYSGQGR